MSTEDAALPGAPMAGPLAGGVPPIGAPVAPPSSAEGWAPPAAAGQRLGKVRNPWGAWALGLVTFGVYYVYWWYKVNDELREFDSGIEVNPALSVLALFVPVANLVTIFKTGARIARAEQTRGRSSQVSGVLGLLLGFVLATHIVYYQSHLNAMWEQQ